MTHGSFSSTLPHQPEVWQVQRYRSELPCNPIRAAVLGNTSLYYGARGGDELQSGFRVDFYRVIFFLFALSHGHVKGKHV